MAIESAQYKKINFLDKVEVKSKSQKRLWSWSTMPLIDGTKQCPIRSKSLKKSFYQTDGHTNQRTDGQGLIDMQGRIY